MLTATILHLEKKKLNIAAINPAKQILTTPLPYSLLLRISLGCMNDYRYTPMTSLEKLWEYSEHLFISSNSQPTFTCLKLTIETLEQGVKCVQS